MQRSSFFARIVSRTGVLLFLLMVVHVGYSSFASADDPVASVVNPSGSPELVMVTFVRKTFTVENSKGRIRLDGRLVTSQVRVENPQAVALIESFDSLEFKTDQAFLDWARKLRGTRTYTYDVVTTVRPNGTMHRIPLVLMSQKDRDLLDPLWNQWLEENNINQEAKRTGEGAYSAENARIETGSSYAESLVHAAEDASRSLSIISGETSLWEVELVEESDGFRANPFDPWGSARTSIYIQALGRTSRDATQKALSNNPGYRVGSVRRFSN